MPGAAPANRAFKLTDAGYSRTQACAWDPAPQLNSRRVRYTEKGLGLRLPLRIPIVATLIVAAIASPGVSGDDFDEYIKELNGRIEAAAADGREWPKDPGGLAGFLFSQDSVVGRGRIYYVAENIADQDNGLWREATISKSSDGTWRIIAIRVCGESDVGELIERRDFLRQASVTLMGFDFVDQGPLELLSFLESWGSNYWVSPILPFGWVKESDLPALVELLDSSEPCASVQSMSSSFIDTTRSNVGNEAAYLIEGYRKDIYPPRLNSTRPFCDIEEIKKWWGDREGT